ncbi:unnamed protein product [Rhizophagus irregularis]|nr:unnamed protein product [Rhizophagus irregularis]
MPISGYLYIERHLWKFMHQTLFAYDNIDNIDNAFLEIKFDHLPNAHWWKSYAGILIQCTNVIPYTPETSSITLTK